MDFLEATCRLADSKPLPSHSELDSAGYESIVHWARDKESGATGDTDGDTFSARASFTFGQPRTRPLYAKLELFLELVFANLYHDPS